MLGERGRGACEHHGVTDRVHAVTGSLGKALGCSAGGFVAGPSELVEWLRQKSVPYLFSGALAPAIVGAANHTVARLAGGDVPLEILRERIGAMRRDLRGAGFEVLGEHHPVLTVMVGDAVALQKMVNRLFEFEVRVHGLCYPVVPEREARIRLQMSANHTEGDIELTVRAFKQAGRSLGLVK